MRRRLLKSKIHRATVTEADLHYPGSITIDLDLMEAADIVEHEQVDVYNVTNGERFTTYAIPGEPGSGVICINGAAAHRAAEGDLVIVASYADYEPEELPEHEPRIVLVDERNRARANCSAGW
jgi:aspartate 1-decarboxylase